MKVKMLKTEKGSVDGIQVQVFEKGTEYDIPEKLAKIFVGINAAEFCKDEVAIIALEAKDAKQAPENKAAKEDKKKDKYDEEGKK
jgi:hypothetical protein